MAKVTEINDLSKNVSSVAICQLNEFDEVCAKLRPILEKRAKYGMPPIKITCDATAAYNAAFREAYKLKRK